MYCSTFKFKPLTWFSKALLLQLLLKGKNTYRIFYTLKNVWFSFRVDFCRFLSTYSRKQVIFGTPYSTLLYNFCIFVWGDSLETGFNASSCTNKKFINMMMSFFPENHKINIIITLFILVSVVSRDGQVITRVARTAFFINISPWMTPYNNNNSLVAHDGCGKTNISLHWIFLSLC